MKSRRTILKLLALAMSGACFAIDPFKAQDNLGPLPGQWTCKHGNQRNTVTFHENQTFSGTFWTDGKVADAYEGTWSLTYDYFGTAWLRWHYLKSNRIPIGRVDTDIVWILNKRTLLLRTGANSQSTYVRISPLPKQQTR